MDNLWTPGTKKQQSRVKTDGLDDLLGDLLDDDVTPKKKSQSQPIGSVRPGTKKQSSKDEDFYSNLAATAEDDLSDISEADVDQMAKSVADLEDMDADLFGGKFKKKGSVKGGSERSSKPNTPRRTGTPRSRSTTPRATSPSARVTSPPARNSSPTHKGVTSPVIRGSSPPNGELSTSPTAVTPNRPGSGKRRTTPSPKAPTPTVPEHKPGTAPGKMFDISSASENLKPGAQTTERPGTVPKAKQKFDFGEFNEDDPLAGLLSDDEEDSIATKPKKGALKQQKSSSVEEPIKKQKSSEDLSTAKTEAEDPKRRSLFDRPPTRSGGNGEEVQKTVTPAVAPKKKEEPGIFSDDDDFLGGLGIEEKGQSSRPVKAKSPLEDDEENRPAKSVMDKLLGKDSAVSKHLDAPKERKEFVLDRKYTKPDVDEEEEDYQFGGYQPSAVSSGSRPTSRRSVRFQDEDDIFGMDRPSPRGRSPASSLAKKPDDMDWLLESVTPSKPSTATASTPKTSTPLTKPQGEVTPASTEAQPSNDTQSADTKVSSQTESKSKSPAARPATSPAAKPKSQADWLGLVDDADDEDEEAFSWMKTKFNQKPQVQPQAQKTTSPRSVAEKRADWLTSSNKKAEEPAPELKKPAEAVSKSSPADWLGLTGKDDDSDDYMGKEIEPETLLQSKSESPVFKPKQVQNDHPTKDRELFTAPQPDKRNAPSPWQSSARPVSASAVMERSTLPQETVHHEPESKMEQLFGKEGLEATDVFSTGHLREQVDMTQPELTTQNQTIPEAADTSTDFFSFNKYRGSAQNQLRMQQEEQQRYLQQQAQLQEMMSNLQNQYQSSMKPQPTQMPSVPFIPETRTSVLSNPPKSLMDAQSRLYKMEIERDYAFAMLEMNKRRFEDEKMAIENSYKSRIELIEDTTKNKETRLRDENEHLMSQYLTKVRQLEQEKSDLITHNQRRIDELERERTQEIERIRYQQKSIMDELKRDHEDAIERLKKAKDQQIEAAVTSHDTTKSLVQAVGMIQENARDLGELQKKVDSWHNMGLDDREIAIRSKDEQLKILQQRLERQQEENEMERKRLEDLVSRLETQIREQTRMLDEERWKVKQEQNRLQSLQAGLEEERRLWAEQQARERANIEKTRESLLEEQKSVLSQLHKERQAVTEERTKVSVAHQVQKEEMEDISLRLSQAKAEYDAIMRTISEEKSKSNSRKREIQVEEEALQEEKRKLEMEKAKMKSKEEELIEAATLLKERSEEVDDLYVDSQRKFEEGQSALQEAKRVETEDQQRAATIQSQLQLLRVKEKEIAEERLRLSKDKKEVENLRSALLCPNCRTPGGTSAMVRQQQQVQQQQPGMNQAVVPQFQSPGAPVMQSTPIAVQMSLNSVGNITENIKADRSMRMWKMEALKDQKYLEEQSMFLYTLKHMPYSSSQKS